MWLKYLKKGNSTYQRWAKLDQGLKRAEDHYHHHVSCWPWHSDECSIEWIWMGGFILEDILIWDDLTIQQHDPRCVRGRQQRLTPGVGTHDLVGECAAERLGLPWLQHTCMYKHTDTCRDTQRHVY